MTLNDPDDPLNVTKYESQPHRWDFYVPVPPCLSCGDPFIYCTCPPLPSPRLSLRQRAARTLTTLRIRLARLIDPDDYMEDE